MFEALAQAVVTLLAWPNIAYLVAGTLWAQLIGILPGLGGSVALALLLPITYGMPAEQAMILLGSALGGVAMGGAIPAILFNAPGTSANIATAFDGYPAARQGRAGEALGAAATACLFGALFGVAVLLAAMPVMRTIVLSLGPPEFLWLAVFGLTIIAAVSGGSLLNGLLAGAFGLLLSFHGLNPVTGGLRYTFGSVYLWDGFPLVPFIIGLFAVAELLHLAVERTSIAEKVVSGTAGIVKGIRFALRHWWLMVRCSAIGVFIGAIPGVGATVSTFIAYNHARNTSRDPDSFGKGNLEGVIAVESNNDAKDGGAFMPMLSLGIPGSPSTAVLLGGLLLHGLTPGRGLLVDELPMAMTLIMALVGSNIITSAVGLVSGTLLARVTGVSTGSLVPVLLSLCLLGAYATRNSIGDVLLTLACGVLGYVMLRAGYPRVPIILGLILGPLAEQNFHLSLQIARGSYAVFFTRPLSIVLMLLTAIGLAAPFVKAARNRRTIEQSGTPA